MSAGGLKGGCRPASRAKPSCSAAPASHAHVHRGRTLACCTRDLRSGATCFKGWQRSRKAVDARSCGRGRAFGGGAEARAVKLAHGLCQPHSPSPRARTHTRTCCGVSPNRRTKRSPAHTLYSSWRWGPLASAFSRPPTCVACERVRARVCGGGEGRRRMLGGLQWHMHACQHAGAQPSRHRAAHLQQEAFCGGPESHGRQASQQLGAGQQHLQGGEGRQGRRERGGKQQQQRQQQRRQQGSDPPRAFQSAAPVQRAGALTTPACHPAFALPPPNTRSPRCTPSPGRACGASQASACRRSDPRSAPSRTPGSPGRWPVVESKKAGKTWGVERQE